MLNCFCVADKCLRKRDGSFCRKDMLTGHMISAKVKHAEAIKAEKKGGIEYERAYG